MADKPKCDINTRTKYIVNETPFLTMASRQHHRCRCWYNLNQFLKVFFLHFNFFLLFLFLYTTAVLFICYHHDKRFTIFLFATYYCRTIFRVYSLRRVCRWCNRSRIGMRIWRVEFKFGFGTFSYTQIPLRIVWIHFLSFSSYELSFRTCIWRSHCYL